MAFEEVNDTISYDEVYFAKIRIIKVFSMSW